MSDSIGAHPSDRAGRALHRGRSGRGHTAAIPCAWEPIATAPQDGSIVLLRGLRQVAQHQTASADFTGLGQFYSIARAKSDAPIYWFALDSGRRIAPVFWMPVPPLTASGIEAGTDTTGTGVAEGESPVPQADAQTQPNPISNDRIRAVLEPFASVGETIFESGDCEGFSDDTEFELMLNDFLFARFSAGHFRAARQLLTDMGGEG